VFYYVGFGDSFMVYLMDTNRHEQHNQTSNEYHVYRSAISRWQVKQQENQLKVMDIYVCGVAKFKRNSKALVKFSVFGYFGTYNN